MRNLEATLVLCLATFGCDEAKPGAAGEDAGVDASTEDAGTADAGDDDGAPVSREPTEVHRMLLRWLTPGQATESRVVEVSGSELATTASSLGAEGYVVTGVLSGDATYTLLGVRNVGGEVRFEAKVEQVSGSALNDVHTALGNDGYVVTASVADSAGVTLVASRPRGSATRYDTRTILVGARSELSEAARMLTADGYAVVNALLIDGAHTLLGARIAGTTPTLTRGWTSLDGLDGHFKFYRESLYGALYGYGYGCVNAAASCDARSCTSICTGDSTSRATFASAFSKMVPADLASETSRFGEAGFIPTALQREGDHYVLLGVGKSLYELAPRPVHSTLTANGEALDIAGVDCGSNYEFYDFGLHATFVLGGAFHLSMLNVPKPGQVYESVGDPSGIRSIFWETSAGSYGNADDQDGTVLYTDDSGRDVFVFRNVTLKSEAGTLEIAGHIACPY